jgi:hypothetical protein
VTAAPGCCNFLGAVLFPRRCIWAVVQSNGQFAAVITAVMHSWQADDCAPRCQSCAVGCAQDCPANWQQWQGASCWLLDLFPGMLSSAQTPVGFFAGTPVHLCCCEPTLCCTLDFVTYSCCPVAPLPQRNLPQRNLPQRNLSPWCQGALCMQR